MDRRQPHCVALEISFGMNGSKCLRNGFFLPYALLAGMVVFTAFLLYKFSGGSSTGYEFAEIAVTTKGMGQVLTLLAIVVTAGAVRRNTVWEQSNSAYTCTEPHQNFGIEICGRIDLHINTGGLHVCCSRADRSNYVRHGCRLRYAWRCVHWAVNNLVYTIVYVTLTFMVGILTRSTGPAIGIGMFMVIMESMVVQLLARYSGLNTCCS